MDASTRLFFENIRLDPLPGTWIDQHLTANFSGATSTGGWPVDQSGCPLTDMGNYLLRVLHVLATFSENLVMGDVISKHIEEQMQALVAEDDLHTANLLDDKHAALRNIKEKLNNTLRECETEWLFTLSTPPTTPRQDFDLAALRDYDAFPGLQEPSLTPMATAAVNHGMYDTVREVPSSTSQEFASSSTWLDESSISPSNAEESITEVPSIEQLKARGKGHYTCPQGTACNKGGVQSDGQLTIYERNSAFRAHLQLHDRMFRCGIPGCTNKKGFARIDQLERHKATTRHVPPSAGPSGYSSSQS